MADVKATLVQENLFSIFYIGCNRFTTPAVKFCIPAIRRYFDGIYFFVNNNFNYPNRI
ncbi:MAG: hypothetical protein Q8941_13345 [Bacteroidota bacterium]|nr:hypothetical protein [Bacteroidota bacterium]